MINETVLTEQVMRIRQGKQSRQLNALLDLPRVDKMIGGERGYFLVSRLSLFYYVRGYKMDILDDDVAQLCANGLLEAECPMNNNETLYTLTELGREVARTLNTINEIELGVNYSDNGTC